MYAFIRKVRWNLCRTESTTTVYQLSRSTTTWRDEGARRETVGPSVELYQRLVGRAVCRTVPSPIPTLSGGGPCSRPFDGTFVIPAVVLWVKKLRLEDERARSIATRGRTTQEPNQGTLSIRSQVLAWCGRCFFLIDSLIGNLFSNRAIFRLSEMPFHRRAIYWLAKYMRDLYLAILGKPSIACTYILI